MEVPGFFIPSERVRRGGLLRIYWQRVRRERGAPGENLFLCNPWFIHGLAFYALR
jgi:hypothetical protein